MRKLASIRQIYEIKPHPNADMLELAIVDGWQCIVRKGEFIAGDYVIYFEIDSVLPVREQFEFLRKGCYVKRDWLPEGEGFRLKTIKLRGEISSGLLLKVEDIFDIVEKDGEKYINICEDNKSARSQNVCIQNNKFGQ